MVTAFTGLGCGKSDSPPKQNHQVQALEKGGQVVVLPGTEKNSRKEKQGEAVLAEEKAKNAHKKKQEEMARFLKRFEATLRDQVVSLGKDGWVRRSFKLGPWDLSWDDLSSDGSKVEVIYQAKKGNTEVFQSPPSKTERDARKAPLSTLPVEYMSFRVFLTPKNGRYLVTGLKKVYPVSCENVDHKDLSPLDPIHSIWTALQRVSEQ